MRIGDYVIRPDANCWVVATIKTFLTGSREGEEYESDVVYPAHYDQALKTLLDRLVKDGIEPDATASSRWRGVTDRSRFAKT